MAVREQTALTLTLTGRLLRTRGVSVYFALLLAVPVVVFFTLREAAQTANTIELGLKVNEHFVIGEASAKWGVRPGDRLVAVEGQSFEWAAEMVDFVRARPPGPLALTFERDGRRWVQVATAELPAQSTRIISMVRLGLGVTVMLFGLFVFVLRPGGAVGWTFLLYCVALGLLLVSRAVFRDLFWMRTRVQAATILATATLGLHLFARFPRTARGFTWKWLFPILYTVAGAMMVTRTLTERNLPAAALHQWLINGWAAACSLTGIVIVFIEHARARREKDAVRLGQYKVLGIAGVLGLAVPMIANAVRMLTGLGGNLADLNTIPVAVFVIATGFALVRHNALEIDRFTAAVVGYAITVVLLGGAFFGVLVALPLLVGGEASRRPEVMVGLTALCFFSAQPLYRALRRAIDRRFLRGGGDDASRYSEALRQAARAVQEHDRDAALKAILNAARELRPDRAELWLLDAEGTRYLRTAADSDVPPVAETLARQGPLGQALSRQQSGGVERLAPKALDKPAQVELWGLALAMVTPVVANGVVAGFLAVGRALSGAAYRSEGLAFLNVLGTQAGLAVERSGSGNLKVGRYRIEKRLGVGGMAEVFLAWQLGPGGFERKVALKRPLPQLADDANCIARFVDEARISAGLRHRNIAQVYEIDQSEGSYFIAMELIDGPALRTLLKIAARQGTPVPLPVALAIGNSLLRALAHAHAQTDAEGRPMGIVHRDVTPNNLLLTLGGEVKLLDFGIARAASQLHTTRTGAVAGTVPYMAPEHARGEAVSPRSDLFSAGAVLYELLTLQKAFPEGYRGHAPRPPSSIHAAVSPELDRFIERALSEDPSFRFQSADEMRAALADAARGVRPAEEEEVARWAGELAAFETRPDVVATVHAATASLEGVGPSSRSSSDEKAKVSRSP